MRHLRNFNSGRIFESKSPFSEIPALVQEHIANDASLKARISKMSAAQLEALEADCMETLQNNKEEAMKVTNERRRYSRNRYGYRLNEGIADSIGDYAKRVAVGSLGGALLGFITGACVAAFGGTGDYFDSPAHAADEPGFLPAPKSTEYKPDAPFIRGEDGYPVLTTNGRIIMYGIAIGAAVGALLGLVTSAVISVRSAFSRGEDMNF